MSVREDEREKRVVNVRIKYERNVGETEWSEQRDS